MIIHNQNKAEAVPAVVEEQEAAENDSLDTPTEEDMPQDATAQETEEPEAVQDTQEDEAAAEESAAPPAITVADYEGYYTCPDISMAMTISKIDDTTVNIVMDNISPNGANAFNMEKTGVLQGEQIVIDFETSAGDMGYITKSGDAYIVDISEHFQAKANTYMSGTYMKEGQNTDTQSSGTEGIEKYLGTYINEYGVEVTLMMQNGLLYNKNLDGGWYYLDWSLESENYVICTRANGMDSFQFNEDASIMTYNTMGDYPDLDNTYVRE